MTIQSVQKKPSGWYIVIDSAGTEYATKSSWIASLAERYHQKEVDVEIRSVRGWFYKELRGIDRARREEQTS